MEISQTITFQYADLIEDLKGMRMSMILFILEY